MVTRNLLIQTSKLSTKSGNNTIPQLSQPNQTLIPQSKLGKLKKKHRKSIKRVSQWPNRTQLSIYAIYNYTQTHNHTKTKEKQIIMRINRMNQSVYSKKKNEVAWVNIRLSVYQEPACDALLISSIVLVCELNRWFKLLRQLKKYSDDDTYKYTIPIVRIGA